MPDPTFDRKRLDVYRLSIDCVAFSSRIAKNLVSVNRPAYDQWFRAAQSVPLNIAEGSGRQSHKDKNRFFESARGSALECASIHDVLRVCNAIDDDSDRRGRSELKRIVSKLTRLIQRRKLSRKIESSTSTSTAMLSTSTKKTRPHNPAEQSDALMSPFGREFESSFLGGDWVIAVVPHVARED